jgi:hypothetical protein
LLTWVRKNTYHEQTCWVIPATKRVIPLIPVPHSKRWLTQYDMIAFLRRFLRGFLRRFLLWYHLLLTARHCPWVRDFSTTSWSPVISIYFFYFFFGFNLSYFFFTFYFWFLFIILFTLLLVYFIYFLYWFFLFMSAGKLSNPGAFRLKKLLWGTYQYQERVSP